MGSIQEITEEPIILTRITNTGTSNLYPMFAPQGLLER